MTSWTYAEGSLFPTDPAVKKKAFAALSLIQFSQTCSLSPPGPPVLKAPEDFGHLAKIS